MTRPTLAPLCYLIALSVAAVCEAVPNDNFADSKTRNIVGGRKVLITVVQDSILPTIHEPGEFRLPTSTSRGITSHHISVEGLEREMELTMAALQDCVPIIESIQGHDFNVPLEAALRKAVENSSWLRPQDIEFSEHGTTDFALDKLDESNTRQMLLLYTSYYTNPNFTAIVVDLQIRLLVRKVPKGMKRAARINPRYIPYEQSIRSRIRLPNADLSDRKKNVARWASDNGRLARAALDTGIADVAALAAISIEIDAKQAKDWRSRGKRKTQEIEGVMGWVRERDQDVILMINARDGAWTRLRMTGAQSAGKDAADSDMARSPIRR